MTTSSTDGSAGRLVSLWGGGPWQDPARTAEAREVAAEVEELGYDRVWLSGGHEDGILPVFADLLDATSSLGIASGIVSIWTATPQQSADAVVQFERDHPGRFLLGVGNSHAPVVEGNGQNYDKPYTRTVEYLDALDATTPLVEEEQRALAALGPRMLELARDRSLGAHPYFVTAAHTGYARRVLGEGPLLAPEVAVVLETDPDVARRIARDYMSMYLQLPNYTSNLRRFGYDDDDLLDGGSDRLLDELIPWGSIDTVVAGIAKHYEAGADEVPIQVLTGDPGTFARAEFRELAAALIS
ncbi:MAG: TIGR03620 family F420-dependent LLM class oxidoreductase [Janthinobacterium lividum]